MMMFYRRRALPKHRFDIIEVDYGGGGHRTRLGDPRDQLLCLHGVPPPPFIKEWRRGRADPLLWRALGSPTPTGSRTPPFLVGVGEEREKEKGAAPLVQFGPEGGCAPPSFWPLSSIPVWPNKAHILPGEFP